MSTIWWYLRGRWTFTSAIKKYGATEDILSACYRNNVYSCRDNHRVMSDMMRISKRINLLSTEKPL